MTDKNNELTRDDLVSMVAANFYNARILNNSHRGDLVEMLVLAALGPEWKFVGLGWHPWDLQRGTGDDRVRIQVKNSAALQLWGKTKIQSVQFGWKKNPPSYFARDNPGEEIEPEGWFCDLFVIGLHLEDNEDLADQADPAQWRFLVIPTAELKRGQSSMKLQKALERWVPVSWHQLGDIVQEAIRSLR